MPTLLSPPHAPTPSANVVEAEPAIVETAQNVGTGTEAEGMAEDDAHEDVDALPVELSVGRAVVGPADGDDEKLVMEPLVTSEGDATADMDDVADADAVESGKSAMVPAAD